MKAMRLVAHEAWNEFRTGLRSGIVTLVFFGLAAYLLMSLTNADYVQKMGATDIPRNAPSLVYLMSSGCMFFLFFAWAWVFAQPLLRDRQVSLHEIVLSMPNSLQALLWGRFIGAALVGALLAGSLIAGFIATPVLEWMGMVPVGSISAPPWRALLFAWVWLLIPAGTGIGALYFLATLRTRNLAGAFGLSAVLMLLWMFTVVVLKGGHINPMLAAALDPSLFTYAQTQVETWTPLQKSTALLPLTPEFLLNRAVWGLAPVLVLYAVLRRIRRESLVLERPAKTKPHLRRSGPAGAAAPTWSARSIPAPRWAKALWLEALWQLRLVTRSRAWWVGGCVLVAMGVLSSFVHGVWHAEGPMVPRPDLLLPLLKDAVFLVIAFIVAALVGLVSRRDDVEGFNGMFDAAPAPVYLRLFGRVIAVVAATVGLSLLPGLSSLLATAIAAPAALALSDPLLYQTLVMAPALIELALLVFLVHALFRRAGVAYTASMLLTFFLVLNHELGLVSYPLYEVGIPAHVRLSSLTGWTPWLDYLLALDAYKLALGALLVAFAGIVLPRGLDRRSRKGFAQPRARMTGPLGALAALSVVAMVGLGVLLRYELVERGGYRPIEASKREDADWERRWLADAGAYSVAGGELRLQVDPAKSTVEGEWTMTGVRAANGRLHAELPSGFQSGQVRVDGRAVQVDVRDDHLVVPLGACGVMGCTVRLTWSIASQGWSAEGETAWRTRTGFWLRAEDAVPRLGLDPDRVLRVAGDRERYGLAPEFALPAASASVPADAVAPAGTWAWDVRVIGDDPHSTHGSTRGPLAFAALWAPAAQRTRAAGLTVVHDRTRSDTARSVAEDVEAMRACVVRRLGAAIEVRDVAQWPRGLALPRSANGLLVLPESPSWDVADAGVGRSLRRARIATALARQHLVSAADLRSGPGALWLSDGVSGAIGLLCVGDADGLDALHRVLIRESDATARALASSDVPVGALSSARTAGWAAHYAPLAALEWTARQSAADFDALTAAILRGASIESALAARAGPDDARAALGAPLASDLSLKSDPTQPRSSVRIGGRRWQWQGGGWKALEQPPSYRLLTRNQGVVRLEASSEPCYPGGTEGLLIDAWPSYERSAKDSLLKAGETRAALSP